MSFILFAGACIETWNLEREDGQRRCTHFDIFVKHKDPPEGQSYRYPKVSDEVFETLLQSHFPPALLAVATTEVIPMNFVAKGERFSSSKAKSKAKLNELISKPAREAFSEAMNIANANVRGETVGKLINFTTLSNFTGVDENYLIESIRDDQTPEPWEEIDERNNWKDPVEIPKFDSLVPWNPKIVRPGTKIQNLEFFGGFKISRRMASFWRKKRAAEYCCCCDLIRNMLKKPWPVGPSLAEMAFKIPMLSALIDEDIKRRLKPVANGALQDTPKPPI